MRLPLETPKQWGYTDDQLAAGRLDSYESAHRQIMRRPLWMGGLMLALDRWPRLRRRVIPALASRPRLFENLLSVHAGEMGFARGASTLAGLTWGVLTR